MKLKITRRGVYDAECNQMEIGDTITVKGDEIPAYLVGKAEKVIGKPEKKPATGAGAPSLPQGAGE